MDEYFAEIAVQEANFWRRRRVHLSSDFEERLAEEDEDRANLIAAGYLGPFRRTWGDRLRLSVRAEAVAAAIEVFQRRERERVQMRRAEYHAILADYTARGVIVSWSLLASGGIRDARAVYDQENALQNVARASNVAQEGHSEEASALDVDDWAVSGTVTVGGTSATRLTDNWEISAPIFGVYVTATTTGGVNGAGSGEHGDEAGVSTDR